MKEINYSKIVDGDDLDNTLDHIKGVVALLHALQISNNQGGTIYDSNAFFVLHNSCCTAIEELEGMKPKLDFMIENIRKNSIES